MKIGKVHMTAVVAGSLLFGSVGGAQLAHTQSDDPAWLRGGGFPMDCQEDEVAVNGGLHHYYDPGWTLECVNIGEMMDTFWLPCRQYAERNEYGNWMCVEEE